MATESTPNTILIHGVHDPIYDEGRVAATKTITPGHLIEVVGTDSNGDDTLQPHSTGGGYAEKNVAIEEYFGSDVRAANRGIDDDYVAGALVRYKVAQPGEEFYLKLAASQTILKTSFLTSNGDGSVKLAATTDQRLFKAMEAVTTTGSAGRVKARAL